MINDYTRPKLVGAFGVWDGKVHSQIPDGMKILGLDNITQEGDTPNVTDQENCAFRVNTDNIYLGCGYCNLISINNFSSGGDVESINQVAPSTFEVKLPDEIDDPNNLHHTYVNVEIPYIPLRTRFQLIIDSDDISSITSVALPSFMFGDIGSECNVPVNKMVSTESSIQDYGQNFTIRFSRNKLTFRFRLALIYEPIISHSYELNDYILDLNRNPVIYSSSVKWGGSLKIEVSDPDKLYAMKTVWLDEYSESSDVYSKSIVSSAFNNRHTSSYHSSLIDIYFFDNEQGQMTSVVNDTDTPPYEDHNIDWDTIPLDQDVITLGGKYFKQYSKEYLHAIFIYEWKSDFLTSGNFDETKSISFNEVRECIRNESEVDFVPPILYSIPDSNGNIVVPDLHLDDKVDLALEVKEGRFNFTSSKYNIKNIGTISNLHNYGVVGPIPAFKVNYSSISLANQILKPLENLVKDEACRTSLSKKSMNADGSEGFYEALYDVKSNKIEWDDGYMHYKFDFVCFDHPYRRAFAFYLDLNPNELVNLDSFYITFDVQGLNSKDFYIINGNDFFTRQIIGNHVIFKYTKIPGMVPESICVSCITDDDLNKCNIGERCIKEGVITNFMITQHYQNPVYLRNSSSLGGLLAFEGSEVNNIPDNSTIVLMDVDIDLSSFSSGTKDVDLFLLGSFGKVKLQTSETGLVHRDLLVWNKDNSSDGVSLSSSGSEFYGLVPNTLISVKRMFVINSIISKTNIPILKIWLDKLELPSSIIFGVPDHTGEFDDLYIRDKVFGFINGFDNQLKYWFKNKEIKVAGLDTLNICKDGYMSGDGLGVVLKDDSMNFSNAYQSISNIDTKYTDLELVDGRYKVTIPNSYDGEHVISITNLDKVREQYQSNFSMHIEARMTIESGSIDVNTLSIPNTTCVSESHSIVHLYHRGYNSLSYLAGFLFEVFSSYVRPGEYFYINGIDIIASPDERSEYIQTQQCTEMMPTYFKNHKPVDIKSVIFPRTLSIDMPEKIDLNDYSVAYITNSKLEVPPVNEQFPDKVDYYQLNSTKDTINICKGMPEEMKIIDQNRCLYVTNHKDMVSNNIESNFTNIPNTTLFDIASDSRWETNDHIETLKSASIREIILFNKDTPLNEIEYIIRNDEGVRRSVRNHGIPNGDGVIPSTNQLSDVAGVFGIQDNRPIFWFRDFNTTIGSALHDSNGAEISRQENFLAEKTEVYVGLDGNIYNIPESPGEIISNITVNNNPVDSYGGDCISTRIPVSSLNSSSTIRYYSNPLSTLGYLYYEQSVMVETLSIILGSIPNISVNLFDREFKCKYKLRLFNHTTKKYIDKVSELAGVFLFKSVDTILTELSICIEVDLSLFRSIDTIHSPEVDLLVNLRGITNMSTIHNLIGINFKGLEPMIGTITNHECTGQFTDSRQLQFNNMNDFDWDTSSILIENVEFATGYNGNDGRYVIFTFGGKELRVRDENVEQLTNILINNPLERFDVLYSNEYKVLTNYVEDIELIVATTTLNCNDESNLVITSPYISGSHNFVNRFKILYVFDRVYHKNDFIQKVYSKIQINVNNLKYPNMVDYTGNTFRSLGTTVKSMEGMFRGISKMSTSSPQIWERNGSVFGKDCFLGDTSISNYSNIPGFWKGIVPSGKTININSSFGILKRFIKLPDIESR